MTQRCFPLIVGVLFVLTIEGISVARAGTDSERLAFRVLSKREAEKAGLPADIADAVMAIESGYDPTRIGGVGEIGLMQVRPATAELLGFKGSTADLAKPEINIHYGVAYLAGAWRRANGDLCRALMKYRAGHGEESMTPLSLTYCGRARAHLAAMASPFADASSLFAAASVSKNPATRLSAVAKPHARLQGAAYWAVHDARIRAMSARIERRWRLMAQR